MDVQGALEAGYTMDEINGEIARRKELLAPVMAQQPAMQQQFLLDQQATTPWQKSRGAVEPYLRPVVEGGLMAGGALLGAPAGPIGGVAGAAGGYATGKRLWIWPWVLLPPACSDLLRGRLVMLLPEPRWIWVASPSCRHSVCREGCRYAAQLAWCCSGGRHSPWWCCATVPRGNGPAWSWQGSRGLHDCGRGKGCRYAPS